MSQNLDENVQNKNILSNYAVLLIITSTKSVFINLRTNSWLISRKGKIQEYSKSGLYQTLRKELKSNLIYVSLKSFLFF